MGIVVNRFNNEQQQRQSREGKSCGLDVKPEVAFRERQERKKTMKRIQIAIMAVGVAGAMSASATTYSGSDFSTMASYNGTYVPATLLTPGYEHLAYGLADPIGDAVVGVRGPLGTLNGVSMSFQYSNPILTGNAPFAAFGVSVDGTWGGTAQEYDIISENGNQLIGTSLVHVWDLNANADVPGLSGVTLNSILGVGDSYDLAPYGGLQVMRAYAYIGDTGGPSIGSVDINSITVGAYEVPEPTTMIAGALLLLPFGATTLRMLRKNRTA
jgi:hypothetical protein